MLASEMQSLPSSSAWLPLSASELPWHAPESGSLGLGGEGGGAAFDEASSPASAEGRGFRWRSMAWSPEVSPKSESAEASPEGGASPSAETSPTLQRSFSSDSPGWSPPAHRFSWSAAPSPTRVSPEKPHPVAVNAAVFLQAWWRGTQVRAARQRAAAVLAVRWRAWKQGGEDRRRLMKLQWAVQWLQAAWRRKVSEQHTDISRLQDHRSSDGIDYLSVFGSLESYEKPQPPDEDFPPAHQDLRQERQALPVLLPKVGLAEEVLAEQMCSQKVPAPEATVGGCPGTVRLRSALRGAARRKLLGEVEDRSNLARAQSPWGTRSVEGHKLSTPGRSPQGRRKSCGSPATSLGPTPERRRAHETSPRSRRESVVPPAESPNLRLETGALILSELLGQGLLLPERPLSVDVADEASEPFRRALHELSARLPPGARIGFTARVSGLAGVAAAAYSAVRETLGPERFLWHGTAWECVPNIVRHGFNRAYAFNARHGSKLGRGVYFAEDPAYALRFAGRTQSSRALLLAGVLPGHFTRGKEGLLEPPRCDSSGKRFDATADDAQRPRVFCVFKDFQALPLYLIQVMVAP